MVGLAKQQHFDLIVIGSGAAGTQAALIAAGLGKRVAVIEDRKLGGDSLTCSDLPRNYVLEAARVYRTSQHASDYGIHNAITSFNFPKIMNNVKNLVARAAASTRDFYRDKGITVIEGRAYFLNPTRVSIGGAHYRADKFIIATGSTWQTAMIAGLSNIHFCTPQTICQMERLPKSVFIVGGHASAVILAQIFASFGVQVYLTCKHSRILPEYDQEFNIALEKTLSKNLGIIISTNSQALEISQNYLIKKILFSHAGVERSVEVDEIVIAEKLMPNIDLGLSNAAVEHEADGIYTNYQLQTSNKNIYAAGDVLNMNNSASAALIEAEIAVLNAFGRKRRTISYHNIPHIVSGFPTVAKVGLTEDTCQQRQIKYRRAISSFSEAPRQLITPYFGMLKIIIDKDQHIIGAQVFGPDAESIIHQLSAAITAKLTVRQALSMPQDFLSWQEIINVTLNKLVK